MTSVPGNIPTSTRITTVKSLRETDSNNSGKIPITCFSFNYLEEVTCDDPKQNPRHPRDPFGVSRCEGFWVDSRSWTEPSRCVNMNQVILCSSPSCSSALRQDMKRFGGWSWAESWLPFFLYCPNARPRVLEPTNRPTDRYKTDETTVSLQLWQRPEECGR